MAEALSTNDRNCEEKSIENEMENMLPNALNEFS